MPEHSIKTKIQLYNSNVKSVLLYGSECWCVINTYTAKNEAFHNGRLWRICRTISNQDIYQRTERQNRDGDQAAKTQMGRAYPKNGPRTDTIDRSEMDTTWTKEERNGQIPPGAGQ